MTYASAAANPTRPRSAIIGVVADEPGQSSAVRAEDHVLAHRLAAHQHGAIDAVYDRYSRPVFGYLLSTLGDRGLAEDVLQQVFLEVWQRARDRKSVV